MRNYRLLRIIIPLLPAVILFILLHTNAESARVNVPAIKGGVLDLAEWDSMKSPYFKMSGEWELYGNKLLDAAAIESGIEKHEIIQFPYAEYSLDNVRTFLKPDIDTYRIHVINAPPDHDLGIRIGQLTADYRIFIDDCLIAETRSLGSDTNAAISDYRNQTALINLHKNSFDIILQIANKYDSRGFMHWPLTFGSYNTLASTDNKLNIINYLAVGSLLIICIFLLLLYLILPREKELVFLFILGMVMIIRLIISQNILIADFLPDIPVFILNQIYYITTYLIPVLFAAFITAVYPPLFPRWFMRSLLFYTIVISIGILLIPDLFFTDMGMIFDCIIMLILIGTIYILGRAAMEGRTGAAGLLTLAACVVSCMLYSITTHDMSLIHYLLNGSGLFYLVIFLVQGVIVAHRFKESRQLQLNAMKGQIRPHFVHNALAAIISISRREPDRARDLLLDLSSYLRGSFSHTDRDLISIEQELELVQAYVALEQARFGGRFEVEYDIEVRDFLLPPLVLQPLVENALVHGLREKDNEGRVLIYIKPKNNNMVQIGVKDDGVGFPGNTDGAGVRKGVGIANINRRLSALYRTQLNYLIPPEGGCEVYLEIPYKEACADESYSG